MSTQTDGFIASNPREWFCLRTQTKREHIAAAMLEQMHSTEVFCPRISQFKKTRIGKKRFIEALFPGYIFAKFSLTSDYRQVIHTQGVRYLVEQGNRRAVPEYIIHELRNTIPQGMVEAPDPSMEPGAHIEFVSGSLKGLNGMVLAQLPATNRVQVLLEFLGNEIRVAVDPVDILLAAPSS